MNENEKQFPAVSHMTIQQEARGRGAHEAAGIGNNMALGHMMAAAKSALQQKGVEQRLAELEARVVALEAIPSVANYLAQKDAG